jgi:mycoredoxin
MNDNPEITFYGASWCPASRRARNLMDRNRILYHWIDIDADAGGCRFVKQVNHGNRSVPTIVWKDGSILVEPSVDELEKKLGITA